MDTPKSVVPGSEFGELLVVSGLALNELTISRNGGGGVGAGGLGEALAAITPLLTLHQFEQTDNASLREKFITQLPSHVSVAVDVLTWTRLRFGLFVVHFEKTFECSYGFSLKHSYKQCHLTVTIGILCQTT